MQREASPPVRMGRRSASPPRREFDTRGGGRSSSRNRSPGYYASQAYESRPRDRERPGGYGGRRDGPSREVRDGRDAKPRDNGWEGRNGRGDERDRPRPRRDEEYSAGDRGREREGDRQRYEVARRDGGGDLDRPPSVEPEKPNFGNSGLLAKETNTVKGVELKYNEPPEARKPLKNWRLYVFKGKEQLDLIHIYRQSAYLVGRDQVVTDIPIAHPSCSKQHAAIQYRQITEKNEFGESSTSVKPFIIDLESTNGTHVNDKEIPKSRYYELRNSDVIKFGTSSREYVLLHEDAVA